MPGKPTNESRWPTILNRIREWLASHPEMRGHSFSAYELYKAADYPAGEKAKLWPFNPANFAKIIQTHHQLLEAELGVQISGSKGSGYQYVFPERDHDTK